MKKYFEKKEDISYFLYLSFTLLQNLPECRKIAESDPAPACEKRRSISSSLLNDWASVAKSEGRTATMLSSISANTCLRNDVGRVAKKL